MRWLAFSAAIVAFAFTELELLANNIGGVAVLALFTGIFLGMFMAIKPASEATQKEKQG